MTQPEKAKPFPISKREVYDAWKRVKQNKGAAGVDGVSIEEFDANLSGDLYKLWNRMSSGSYFPKAVKRVEIPKIDGGMRPLGIPTVNDRIAQEVVRKRLEGRVEPRFHPDSFGFRPGKSAKDALEVCRWRCWKNDWVLDVDIKKCFDSIDHQLLIKAVEKYVEEPWELLYIKRWLEAAIRQKDGRLLPNVKGIPQGGVISPLLANVFLHYAFDKWMERQYPSIPFERYADDMVIHYKSEGQVLRLKQALKQRFAQCKLSLHPEKTQMVYCKDSFRKLDYPCIQFTFLGYTFRPRKAKSRKTGKLFTSFLPAVSQKAQKRFRQRLKAMHIPRRVGSRVEEIAEELNPFIRGWMQYFSFFRRRELFQLYAAIDRTLTAWSRRKYRKSPRQGVWWLNCVKASQPTLFAHWVLFGAVYG